MAEHIYHWKHGWIPLDHVAALSKAKGNHQLAARMLSDAHAHDAGIRNRKDIAGAIKDLHNIPSEDRAKPMHQVQDAAEKHDAKRLLPEQLRKWESSSGNIATVKQHASGRVHVTSPYDKSFVSGVKEIGGTWSPKSKTWSVPGDRAAELDKLLSKHYGSSDHVDARHLPSGVTITTHNGRLQVRGPYNEGFRVEAKGIGTWNAKDRSWEFPSHAEQRVREAIHRNYKSESATPRTPLHPSAIKPPAKPEARPASQKQIDYAWSLISRASRRDDPPSWYISVDPAGAGHSWPTYSTLQGLTSTQISRLIDSLTS